MGDDDDPFDWEVRNKSTPFMEHAVAGSCAGVMEHVSTYPIDTVKTQMQASEVRMTMREAARAVLRREGVFGLMRGSSVIGVGCIPAHIGFFGTYEIAVDRWLGERKPHEHPLRMAACGAAATAVHDCVLTPHDVLKQRLQLGRHTGPYDCITSLWRTQGLVGFYRSLPVTLAMNIPFTGTLVACNVSLQTVLGICRGGSSQSELRHAPWYFLTAGVSGAIAGAMTTPLDVIKTRLQTQEGQHIVRGVVTTSRIVARQNGWMGLFNGVGPRVLLAAPSSAVSWGTYETIRTLLQQFNAASSAGGKREPQTQQVRTSSSKLQGGVERSRCVEGAPPLAQPLLSEGHLPL